MVNFNRIVGECFASCLLTVALLDLAFTSLLACDRFFGKDGARALLALVKAAAAGHRSGPRVVAFLEEASARVDALRRDGTEHLWLGQRDCDRYEADLSETWTLLQEWRGALGLMPPHRDDQNTGLDTIGACENNDGHVKLPEDTSYGEVYVEDDSDGDKSESVGPTTGVDAGHVDEVEGHNSEPGDFNLGDAGLAKNEDHHCEPGNSNLGGVKLVNDGHGQNNSAPGDSNLGDAGLAKNEDHYSEPGNFNLGGVKLVDDGHDQNMELDGCKLKLGGCQDLGVGPLAASHALSSAAVRSSHDPRLPAPVNAAAPEICAYTDGDATPSPRSIVKEYDRWDPFSLLIKRAEEDRSHVRELQQKVHALEGAFNGKNSSFEVEIERLRRALAEATAERDAARAELSASRRAVQSQCRQVLATSPRALSAPPRLQRLDGPLPLDASQYRSPPAPLQCGQPQRFQMMQCQPQYSSPWIPLQPCMIYWPNSQPHPGGEMPGAPKLLAPAALGEWNLQPQEHAMPSRADSASSSREDFRDASAVDIDMREKAICAAQYNAQLSNYLLHHQPAPSR